MGSSIFVRFKTDLFLQSHNFIPIGPGYPFSSLNHRIDSLRSKTGRSKSFQIRIHIQIHHRFIILITLHAHKSRQLIDDPHDIIQSFLIFQPCAEIHPDGNFGSHIFSHIHGKIIRDTSVYQYHTIDSYGSENSRDSHTRPHRQRQYPLVHHHFFPIDHIGRHTSERNR